MGNPKAYIKKIRREIEASRDTRLWRDAINMLSTVSESVFSRSAHFILEIVQNAEDAGARTGKGRGEIEFRISPDRIIVTHNGSRFTEQDVDSICGVRSNKKPELGTLCYLGIGFKSVFKISDCPEIHSGGFHFKFDKGAYADPSNEPWQITPLWVGSSPLGLDAYTAGSINWGYPVARKYGVDIVTTGNRNPGAANVFRIVGPLPGVIVYLADRLTATVVVAPTHWLPLSDTCMLVASGMVIVGTMFPVFSHFRGGTGLAKSTRVAAGVNPFGLLLALPLGLFVLGTLRNGAWVGVLGLGVVLLASAFISQDAVGVISIAMAGALISIRSRVQYREGRKA